MKDLLAEESDFSRAVFDGGFMLRAVLIGSRFGGARLQEVVLTGAALEEADFTAADLSRALLNGAQFSGAIFTDADLGEARFVNGRLEGGNFRGAKNVPKHLREMLER